MQIIFITVPFLQHNNEIKCTSRRLQLQPLNISWTTVMEPALAASQAADLLQTCQTLLPGYFFPTARLPR